MTLTRRRVLAGVGAAAGLAAVTSCSARSAGPPRDQPTTGAPVRIAYGQAPDQYAELSLPASAAGSLPVVVLIHGGFWLNAYAADLGRPLAADLVSKGIATWNLEYRRVGGGGGWPATFEDVAVGLDALATAGQQTAGGRLDLDRVVAVGHSAGGQLAVWAAGRHHLPATAPGAAPVQRLRGVVSQAGVLDLAAAAAQRLGGRSTQGLLGGTPEEYPDRYALASPVRLVPIGVPVTCVHGDRDDLVPIEQSKAYVAAATSAGDTATLTTLPGADHFVLIDPASSAWGACRDAAMTLLA